VIRPVFTGFLPLGLVRVKNTHNIDLTHILFAMLLGISDSDIQQTVADQRGACWVVLMVFSACRTYPVLF